MRYLSEWQAQVMHAWWYALQPDGTVEPLVPKDGEKAVPRIWFGFDRGPRARLRRAASLEEMCGEAACFALRQRLGPLDDKWLGEHDEEWLFLVAGTVARVKYDTRDRRTLAAHVGRSTVPVDESAPMSELRFRNLMREQHLEDFYRQLRRAIDLAGGKLDVAQLADDLLAWCAERRSVTSPASSMRFRWARDYYLDRKDLKFAPQTGAGKTPSSESSQESIA